MKAVDTKDNFGESFSDAEWVQFLAESQTELSKAKEATLEDVKAQTVAKALKLKIEVVSTDDLSDYYSQLLSACFFKLLNYVYNDNSSKTDFIILQENIDFARSTMLLLKKHLDTLSDKAVLELLIKLEKVKIEIKNAYINNRDKLEASSDRQSSSSEILRVTSRLVNAFENMLKDEYFIYIDGAFNKLDSQLSAKSNKYVGLSKEAKKYTKSFEGKKSEEGVENKITYINLLLAKCLKIGKNINVSEYPDPAALINFCTEFLNLNGMLEATKKNLFQLEPINKELPLHQIFQDITVILDDFKSLKPDDQKAKLHDYLFKIIFDIGKGLEILNKNHSYSLKDVCQFLKDSTQILGVIICDSDDFQEQCKNHEQTIKILIEKLDVEAKQNATDQAGSMEYYDELESLSKALHFSAFKYYLYTDIPILLRRFNSEVSIDEHRRGLYVLYQDLAQVFPNLLRDIEIFNDGSVLLGTFVKELMASKLGHVIDTPIETLKSSLEEHVNKYKNKMRQYKDFKGYKVRVLNIINDPKISSSVILIKKCYLNLLEIKEDDITTEELNKIINTLTDLKKSNDDTYQYYKEMVQVHLVLLYASKINKILKEDDFKSILPHLRCTIDIVKNFLSPQDQLMFYKSFYDFINSNKPKSNDKDCVTKLCNQLSTAIKINIKDLAVTNLRSGFASLKGDKKSMILNSAKILSLIPLYYYQHSDFNEIIAFCVDIIAKFEAEQFSILRLDLCSFLINIALENSARVSPAIADSARRFAILIQKAVEDLKKFALKADSGGFKKAQANVLTLLKLVRFDKELFSKLNLYSSEDINTLLSTTELAFYQDLCTALGSPDNVRPILENSNSNIWLEALSQAFFINISNAISMHCFTGLTEGADLQVALFQYIGKLKPDLDSETSAIFKTEVVRFINATNLPSLSLAQRNLSNLFADYPKEYDGLVKQFTQLAGLKNRIIISMSYAKDMGNLSLWPTCMRQIVNKAQTSNDYCETLENLLEVFVYYDNLAEFSASLDNPQGLVALYMQNFLTVLKKAVINDEDLGAYLKDPNNFDVRRFDFPSGHRCLNQLSNLLSTHISKSKPTMSFASFKKLYELILRTNAHHNEALLSRVNNKAYTVWWIELKSEEIMRLFAITPIGTLNNNQIEFKTKLVDCFILLEKKYKKSDIDEFVNLVKHNEIHINTLYTVLRQFQSNRWELSKEVVAHLAEVAKISDTTAWLNSDTDRAITNIRVKQITGGQRSVEQIMECIRGDVTGANQSVLELATPKPANQKSDPAIPSKLNLKEIMDLIEIRYKALKNETITKEWVRVWAMKFKALGPNKLKDDANVVELCAVLNWAVFDSGPDGEKYRPRNTQMVALLLFIDGIRTGIGRVANISTGEGKTLITQMLAITRALNNEVVDVITSSSVYAQRDAKLAVNLMDYFNIVVTNNCDSACESEEERKKRYQTAHVIYGDTGAFQRDLLLTRYMEKNIRPNPKARGDSVIIDEADSALLDNASRTLYISHSIEDLQNLRELFVVIWSAVQNSEVIVHSPENVKKVVKIIQNEIEQKNIIVPQGKYMKEFIQRRLKIWVENAYRAKDMVEGDQYTVAQDTDKKGQALVMDLNTGVEQVNTQWSNGLHQFIQIKHRNKLTDESLKAVFISNLAFFREYKSNLNGMTGTLGGPDDRNYMTDFYSGLDFFVLPRFKPERFIMEDAVIVPTMELWGNAIVGDIREKLDVKDKRETYKSDTKVTYGKSEIILLDDDCFVFRVVQEKDVFSKIFEKSSQQALKLLEENVSKLSPIIDASIFEILTKVQQLKDSDSYLALMKEIKSIDSKQAEELEGIHSSLKDIQTKKDPVVVADSLEKIRQLLNNDNIRLAYLRFAFAKHEINNNLLFALIQFQYKFIKPYVLDSSNNPVEYVPPRGVESKRFPGRPEKRVVLKKGSIELLEPVVENIHTYPSLIEIYDELKSSLETEYYDLQQKIPTVQLRVQHITSELQKLGMKFTVTEDTRQSKIEDIKASLSTYQSLLDNNKQSVPNKEATAESASALASNEDKDKRAIIDGKIKKLKEELALIKNTLSFDEVQKQNADLLKQKELALNEFNSLKSHAEALSTKISSAKRKIARYEKASQADALLLNGKRARSVLAICENQLSARAIHSAVTKNYPLKPTDFVLSRTTPHSAREEAPKSEKLFLENKVIKYDTALKEFVHEDLSPGDVIVATNIAGRGMDLDTIPQLEDNNGLQVDLTFIPEDERTSIQNFGRTARKGHEGSGRYIVYDPRAATQHITISMLLDERDERASARMAQLRRTKMPRMITEETLFQRFTKLQDSIRKTLRDSHFEDAYISLQIKSLQDRWAFWLDKHEEELNRVFEQGDTYLLAELEAFATECEKAIHSERYGLVDSVGELYKLARFFFKLNAFEEAERCYDRIIEIEPEYCALAHYYKAQSIFGQEKRVEVSGKKSARDHLKLAIKKLETESNRLSSANQIVKVISDLRQKKGEGLEVDRFTASNINIMSFYNIHIDAAKEVLGQDFSEKTVTGGPIVGQEAQKAYDHMRKHNPHLIKDFRISHKLSFKYELFWRKHIVLNLNVIKDTALIEKLQKSDSRLVLVDKLTTEDRNALEKQGVNCKKIIVRARFKNLPLDDSNTSVVRLPASINPVNDKVIEVIESAWSLRSQAKSQVQGLRTSGLFGLRSAVNAKSAAERFDETKLRSFLYTKDMFIALLKELKSVESQEFHLHAKFQERAMGTELWNDPVFSGKGLKIKAKILSNTSLRTKEALSKEIQGCFDPEKPTQDVIEKIILKLSEKDNEIIICESAFAFSESVTTKLDALVHQIKLDHPITPQEFKFLDLANTPLAPKASALLQSLSVPNATYNATQLNLSEKEFEGLWIQLNHLDLLKYDVYECLNFYVNSEERNQKIPKEYQAVVAFTIVRLFLENQTLVDNKKMVKFSLTAIPFSQDVVADIATFCKQLIDQEVLKKPAPRYPVASNPDNTFNETKIEIGKALDGLLTEVNKKLLDEIRSKEAEIDACREGPESTKRLILKGQLDELKKKRKEYEDALIKMFETIIGKIRFIGKLKISKKTLDDYLKEGKMPPEIVDFTRRCLFEVMSLVKDLGFSWDAFFCALLGLLQIIAGCIVTALGGGMLGQILIREGIGDMVYAIQAGISGNFSWDAYAERKLLSVAMSVLMSSFSVLVEGKEVLGAASNVQSSTLIASIGKEVLAHVGEALIEVSVSQAASALIDAGSKSILEGLVNSIVGGITSSKEVERLEFELRKDYAKIYRKFGDLDSRAIAAKILQDGNLAQVVQSKVSSHAVRYIQMAMQGLSKLSNNGGSILKTIGKVAQGLSMIGAYAGSAKIAAEIVGDVETIMRDMHEELNEMYNTKVARNGIGNVTIAQEEGFASDKVKQTRETLIEQAKAVINNSVLNPILQTGLKYVADRMTEGTLQALMKDANELAARAKIEQALKKHDAGEKVLTAEEHVKYVFQLSKLEGGSLHSASSLMKKLGGSHEVMIGSEKVTLAVAVAKFGGEKNIFLNQKEDGYHAVKLNYSEMLEAMKSKDMPGDFSLRIIATVENKKIVILDPDTLLPHQSAPDGFSPVGGDTKDEIRMVLHKNGQLTLCPNDNTGLQPSVAPAGNAKSSTTTAADNAKNTTITAAANLARTGGGRTGGRSLASVTPQDQDAQQYLEQAAERASSNPRLKASHDCVMKHTSSPNPKEILNLGVYGADLAVEEINLFAHFTQTTKSKGGLVIPLQAASHVFNFAAYQYSAQQTYANHYKLAGAVNFAGNTALELLCVTGFTYVNTAVWGAGSVFVPGMALAAPFGYPLMEAGIALGCSYAAGELWDNYFEDKVNFGIDEVIDGPKRFNWTTNVRDLTQSDRQSHQGLNFFSGPNSSRPSSDLLLNDHAFTLRN